MARLPYLDIDDLDEKDHDLLKRPINLFRQLVNSTGGARAFGTLGHYIRYKSTLDPRIREMAIIQVGFLTIFNIAIKEIVLLKFPKKL